ncbi:hypothetical protein HAX54_010564, partial [Datura stramonium]|nr:hypothetical protein [Datura stramonium]
GFPKHILLEKFYTGLEALTQSVDNNSIGGCFKENTSNRIVIVLNKIANHNHAWHGGDQSEGINKGTNIALLTKKLTEFEVNK